jgi:hypothetical protein
MSEEIMYIRRWTIFRHIDFIHHFYKGFLKRELEKCYGKRWAKEGLPDDVYGRFLSCGLNWEKTKIYLGDIAAILAHSNNWEKCFSIWFKGKTFKEIKEKFIRLTELVNKGCYHSDYLTEDNVEEVKKLVRELFVNNAEEEFEKILKGEKLTYTEIKIGRLIIQLNGISSAEELAKLTDLPIHIVKMILRESFVRMGLMSVATGAEISSGIIAGAPILEEENRFKPYEEIYFLTLPIKEVLKRYPELKIKDRNYG